MIQWACLGLVLVVPLARHFYPALSRDPSPRVYSRRARVIIDAAPWHEVLSVTALDSSGALMAGADRFFDFAQDDGRGGRLVIQWACLGLVLMDPSTSLRMTRGSGRVRWDS